MNEPWADWRTTNIPCPSCTTPLLHRKQFSATQTDVNYCCAYCGISWEKEPGYRRHERRWAIFGALSIAFLIAPVYALHAAAQSICLAVMTDGTPICVDVPTYHDSIHSRGAMTIPTLAGLCAIWLIPLIAGVAAHCRHWCGIVSLAIVIGYGTGFVIGPLIVRYRYQELYWDNPALFAEMITKSLGSIMLSLPLSILATWVAFGRTRDRYSIPRLESTDDFRLWGPPGS